MASHVYKKIENYLEVKRKILEVKKNLYISLHDILEDEKNQEKFVDKLDKILVKIGEIKDLLDDFEKRLPPKEEIAELLEESKKRGKKTKESTDEVPIQKTELSELEKIEEELRKIEEELKKLSL